MESCHENRRMNPAPALSRSPMMGTFAEFERALIHERQRKGIALAK